MIRFVKNLAFLGILGLILYIVAPDMMRQVFELFGGVGILPLFLMMVVLAALPQRSRRRHR